VVLFPRRLGLWLALLVGNSEAPFEQAGEFFAAREGSEEEDWGGGRGSLDFGLGCFLALPCYIGFTFFLFLSSSLFCSAYLPWDIYTRMVKLDWTGLVWAELHG